MKKNKFLLFFAILLIILFIISFFVEFNGIKLNSIWFAIAVLFIGLYSLFYYLMYGLDSSLYYGTLITLCGVVNLTQNLLEIKALLFYPIYILCFAFASFAVFAIFRQNIHFKLFAILLIEGILLISYKMNYLNIWQIVFVNGIYLLILLIRSIFRVRKNLRRVK